MPPTDAKPDLAPVRETPAPRAEGGPRFGSGFLRDIWYFAALSGDLRPGKLQRYEILGEPILLGRKHDGSVYALRDVCPHRAAPLSAGRLVREAGGGEVVECPYHGWRFRADGVCSAIPSMVEDQEIDVGRIRVRAYPVAESQGLVFVWMTSDSRGEGEPDQLPPTIPGIVGGKPKLIDRMVFDAHIDHAVVGLMDPAHGPYVHQNWWWRSAASQHEKAKAFEAREAGFAMVRHPPSKNSYAYRLLGGAPLTEIVFHLPGLRWEHIEVGKRLRRPAVPAPGRGDGEPAEPGAGVRSRPAMDRRRRPAGQMVSGPEAGMGRQSPRGPRFRQSGGRRRSALAQLSVGAPACA